MSDVHSTASGQIEMATPKSLLIAYRLAGGTNVASGVYGNIIIVVSI